MHIFPYQYKHIEYGKIINPLILLPVKSEWGWQNLWFIVDSGADTTMLPLSLAKKFGFSCNPDKKIKLFGIGEQAVFASPGEIICQINGDEIKTRSYFTHSDNSSLLLGRLDIFDKFSIMFDAEKQQIVFSKINKPYFKWN